MKSKKLFSKRTVTDLIRGHLLVTAILLSVNSVSAREQWQIERPDPPPTAPPASSRWTAGGQNQPAQSGGWNGPSSAVPGLAQPGTVSSSVPGFNHSAQLPATGGGSNVPGLIGGSQPQAGYGNAQMPGYPVVPPLQASQASGQYAAAGQVPGLVSQGVPGTTPSMPPIPVQTGQGGVMPDFLKNILGQRLQAGTVLTGVAEMPLSSKGSKRGDVFSIVLPHGFGDGNEMLIPPGSKILGVVVDAFSASTQRVGMPGRLSISLKTLLFPDGRTTKINAFIDHNPAHDQESEPKTRFAGLNASDYGKAFKGMLYSSVAGISWVHNKQMTGKEFVMKPGTPLSVKLNTSIDIAKMTNPAQAFQGTPGLAGVPTQPYPGNAGGAPGLSPQGAVPGLSGGGSPTVNGQQYGTPQPVSGLPTMNGQPYGTPQPVSGLPTINGQPYGTPQPVSGLPTINGQPYGTPQPVSGLPTVNGQPYGTPQPVSGLPTVTGQPYGTPETVNSGTFFPNDVQNADQFQAGSQALSQEQLQDPNSIFKTPISSPGVNTAEPF